MHKALIPGFFALCFFTACSDGNSVDDSDASVEDAVDGLSQDAGSDDSPSDDSPGADTIFDAGEDSGGDQGQQPVTVAGCMLFPPDNFWNTPIDAAPLDPNSDVYIASIGADTNLHPDFGSFWQGEPLGIPWTSVPADQPMVEVRFEYDDESDPGPYPIPSDAPIEGGPESDGDRHVLVIQRDKCVLYEMYNSWPQQDGTWDAGSGAIWHLDQNEVRPADWTSADAAGLAILPGLVRWEEVYQDGEIRHAMRVTLEQIQHAYVLPAVHSDGQCGSNPSCPPMGLRLRLKAEYDDSFLPPKLQVFTRAMKKYGLVIADTGGDLFVSGVHDPRWDDDLLHELTQITAGNFEAVYTGEIIQY